MLKSKKSKISIKRRIKIAIDVKNKVSNKYKEDRAGPEKLKIRENISWITNKKEGFEKIWKNRI